MLTKQMFLFFVVEPQTSLMLTDLAKKEKKYLKKKYRLYHWLVSEAVLFFPIQGLVTT